MTSASLREKIVTHTPLSRAEALWLYQQASLEELSDLASISRAHYHPPSEATYLIMGIINYTNVCVARCDYCAFYRLPHEKDSYLLSLEQLCQRIDQLAALGGRMVSFNGGFHPKLRLHDYAELFAELHKRYPTFTIYAMTVAEFMFACKTSKLSYDAGAALLREAGCRWVTGGGAEILDDGFRRRHSPGKYTVADYFTAQAALLAAGLGSTATMVIGFDESLEERLNHLESLRAFQEAHERRLVSFLCWTYKPWNNRLGGQEISSEEYLRWLAICRLYLHNFKHIRTSVLTRNEDGLQGLKFGANDFDLPTEDEVTQKAGATISHDFESILAAARAQGFTPMCRETWQPV